jgi:uncharacterized protein YlxW (UPF0749 family)
MTLLREVMEQPLDPGYAAAAEHPGRPRPPVRVAVFVLAALLGGLAVTAVLQLRAPEPAAIRSRQLLETQIKERTAVVERQQNANAVLRDQIRARQSAELEASGSQELARQVDQLRLATGEAPVEGPGLVLTVKDSPQAQNPDDSDPVRGGGEPGEGRVLDRDLQVIVNGYWVAGAEAIAVNGRRLTARSAIRSAGEAILVDFRPIAPPYDVQVIGDPSTLRARFSSGASGAYLQYLVDNYGISSAYETPPKLTLNGAANLSLREASPVPSPSPSAGSLSSPSNAPGSPSPSRTSSPAPEVSP